MSRDQSVKEARKRKSIPKGYSIRWRGRASKEDRPYWMLWLDPEKKRVTITQFEKAADRRKALREGARTYDDALSPKIKKNQAAKIRRRKAKTRIVEGVEPSELASALGIGERRARNLIEKGGANLHEQDVALAIVGQGGRAYPEPTDYAKRSRVGLKEKRMVEDLMRAFVHAVENGKSSEEIQQTYRAWRRIKDQIRPRMTSRAWREMITAIGKVLELDDIGVFSIERFRKS